MARFESIEDIVDSLCLRSGDIQRRNKGLYLDCAQDVWDDMNESSLKISERVKMPIRKKFFINKMTNTIDLPTDLKKLNSVSIQDKFGNIYPCYRNDKVKTDLVDISVIGNCACEHNCGYHLCNTMKGYEAIESVKTDKNPDGSDVSFTCVDRKVIHGNFLYIQTQYPKRIYYSGVWVETVKYTEDVKMCEVEVDHNGCVKDTEQNINAICSACGIDKVDPKKCCIGGDANTPPKPNCDTWIYSCINKMDWFYTQCGGLYRANQCYNNIYNITSTGNQLIFPANFGHDSVILRYFEDVDLFDIMVPYLAKPAFMMGLQAYATAHHEKKQPLHAVFAQRYSKLKFALLSDLNKFTIDEYQMILTPPVYVPSYIGIDYWGDGDNWN